MNKTIITRIVNHAQRFEFYHPWFKFPAEVVHGIAALAPQFLEPVPGAYRLLGSLEEAVEYIDSQEESKELVALCIEPLLEYYTSQLTGDYDVDRTDILQYVPFYAEFKGYQVVSPNGRKAALFYEDDWGNQGVRLSEPGKPYARAKWSPNETLIWLGYNVDGGKRDE